MDLTKKLLALLAIFCIIASASAVCAADNVTDDGYAGVNYEDMNCVSGSQYQDDGGWAGSQYNGTAENAVAAGETASATTNMTANATSAHTMPATGNPILLLLGVSAVLGGCGVALRKK